MGKEVTVVWLRKYKQIEVDKSQEFKGPFQ